MGGCDGATETGAKDCYNSTKHLLESQLKDVNDDNTQEYKVYEICSGLEIDVGYPNADFTDFSDGDYPIILVRFIVQISLLALVCVHFVYICCCCREYTYSHTYTTRITGKTECYDQMLWL